MGKLTEIRNDTQDRAFDLIRESDALYLSIKCSDATKHCRIVRIKVTDVFYQIWNNMNSKEKREMYRMVNK